MNKKLIRKFKRRHKQVVKKSKFFLRHPLLMPVAVFIVMFCAGLMLLVMAGASTKGASDARIVNLFADGEQRTVTTRAKTIGDLLQRLNFPIQNEDIVEPSKDTLILEDNTQVNIYRARPVVVNDGDRIITVLTAQRAPRLVAHEAGLNLLTEDKAEFERVDDDVLEVGASEQLVVTRSIEVQLNVYGAIKLFRTTATTVEELLKEENILPQDGDTIEPVNVTPISSGMLVSINRKGVKTIVVSEPIAYTSEVQDNADIEAGKTQVQTAGVNGERAVVYEILEKDGIEVSRTVIQEVVLKNPITEVVLRGTKIIAPKFSSTLTVSGDKAALMEAAGISSADFGFVDYVVSKESQWRPGVANSYSGAYGLCQALPASKMSSAGADYLTNPITQLKWCSGYAEGRYGSWAGAYESWQVQGWW
jgi:uncharacterized protein YabE (DUF348 family)